jgi:predicted mannosyl-3-phosphoglycerate phosphatase (HAD superfamily)
MSALRLVQRIAMKVIFLDVDGVLIPYGWGDVKKFKPSCVDVLKEMLFVTDAKLVISSSWRLGEMERLMRLLDEAGIASRVIGTTTTDVLRKNKTFRMPSDIFAPHEQQVLHMDSVSRSRTLEIQDWLDNHPDVHHYIVLDDEPKLGFAQITPECHTGLVPEHATTVIRFFAALEKHLS